MCIVCYCGFGVPQYFHVYSLTATNFKLATSLFFCSRRSTEHIYIGHYLYFMSTGLYFFVSARTTTPNPHLLQKNTLHRMTIDDY